MAMVDLSKLHPAARSAAMRGGTDGWGEHGSAYDHIRYSQTVQTRRYCRCGCKTKITHNGMANGVCLMSGCEMYVARWVKDPTSIYRRLRK